MPGFLKKLFGKGDASDTRYGKIFQEIFGIRPGNIELYKLALVHRSASVFLPDGSCVNNERLEFLGDSVIQTAISEYLFIEYPDKNEGFLTRTRSKLVSRATLDKLSVEIGLAGHVVCNPGGSFIQKHLYGDALEAAIGAIYLDKGYDVANRVLIEKVLQRHLDLGEITNETDFKSRLIEWCQKSKHTIRFDTGFGEGSTAQKPVFRSVAVIDDMELGYGIGATKKEAEQNAAFSVSNILSDTAGDTFMEMLDKIS